MSRITLAEIDAYDPTVGSARRLHYATEAFITGPADSPPNTIFLPRILQPAVMSRTAFGPGTTQGRSQVGFGDLVLANDDGDLDPLLDYGFDGRMIVLRQGESTGTYPDDFPVVLRATMDTVDVGDTVTVKLRDRIAELDVPVQPFRYAGDNVLPAGLEGTADDLKGHPKPRCFGTVKNVPAPQVNTSKLIYQVNDGPVASVDGVYDRGVELGIGRFVLVGSGGVSISVDGITWATEGDTGLVFALNGICWSPERSLWVAAGYATSVARSGNGRQWTESLSGLSTGEPATDVLHAAVWADALDMFVVGGIAPAGVPVLAISHDGIVWLTINTTGFGASGAVRGLAWSPDLGQLIAVGFDGVNGVLSTSTDAEAWTTQTPAGFVGRNIWSAAWSAALTLWVIVGAGGELETSPDGVTWTARTSGFGSSDIFTVTWSPELSLFVAGGLLGVVTTSPDGINWTSRTSNVTGNIRTVPWSKELGLFALGTTTNKIATSPDGITWTVRTSNYTGSFVGGAWNEQMPPGSYADANELQDDTLAPIPGSYKSYLNGGYFRLGATPDGLVTADVTAGGLAGDRTAGQIFAVLLRHPMGTPTMPVSRDDTEDLDIAAPYTLGLWTGTEEMHVADACDRIANAVGAWWGVDRTGLFRIEQFTAPSGSAVLSLTEHQIVDGSFRRLAANDVTRHPSWRSILRYQRNYAVQDTDIAASVTDARRAFLTAESRDAVSEDATVKLAHSLAREAIDTSLIQTSANAATEVARRQTLRGTLRHRYELTTELTTATDAVDIGHVVSLTHSRLGFSAGRLLRIIGIVPDRAKRTVRFTGWR